MELKEEEWDVDGRLGPYDSNSKCMASHSGSYGGFKVGLHVSMAPDSFYYRSGIPQAQLQSIVNFVGLVSIRRLRLEQT